MDFKTNLDLAPLKKAKQEQERAASKIRKQRLLLKRHNGRFTRTGIFTLSKENKDCRCVTPVFNLKIPQDNNSRSKYVLILTENNPLLMHSFPFLSQCDEPLREQMLGGLQGSF